MTAVCCQGLLSENLTKGEQFWKDNRMGILWLVLIIVGWIVLQAYILPKFGISTWMAESCRVGDKDKTEKNLFNKQIK